MGVVIARDETTYSKSFMYIFAQLFGLLQLSVCWIYEQISFDEQSTAMDDDIFAQILFGIIATLLALATLYLTYKYGKGKSCASC